MNDFTDEIYECLGTLAGIDTPNVNLRDNGFAWNAMEAFVAAGLGKHGVFPFRVWPDGTVQAVEDGAPHSHMSDDFVVVFAASEGDALLRSPQ